MLHLVGVYIIYINDAGSNKYQRKESLNTLFNGISMVQTYTVSYRYMMH